MKNKPIYKLIVVMICIVVFPSCGPSYEAFFQEVMLSTEIAGTATEEYERMSSTLSYFLTKDADEGKQLITVEPKQEPSTTVSPTSLGIINLSDSEKADALYGFLQVGSVTQEKAVELRKFLPRTSIELSNNVLTYIVDNTDGFDVDEDEELSLCLDYIFWGAYISKSDKNGDWGLQRIQVIFESIGNSSLTYYIDGKDRLNEIYLSENPNLIFDYLEYDIDWGNIPTPDK